MITVDEAHAFLRQSRVLHRTETVPIEQAMGRICAADIIAALTQPPFRASVMDGYAVRLDDVRKKGATLKVIGESRAGHAATEPLAPGTAMRISTGAVVPDDADHVVMQENAIRDGDVITIIAAQQTASNIRKAGIDFCKGDILKRKGEPLTAIDIGLLAAANIPALSVYSRPVVAYFDNGDELVDPGGHLQHGQIIASNRFALDGMIRQWGGEPQYLGKASDTQNDVADKFKVGLAADILVSMGGASVGDHDHVCAAFEDLNGRFIFQKIAMKPGKPTWFGRLKDSYVLGLPGNPASAMVCAILFLQSLIRHLSSANGNVPVFAARLAKPVAANGPRENYMRGRYSVSETGIVTVTPADNQDSSLLSRLSSANCLIKCPVNMPAKKAGENLDCIRLSDEN